MYECKWYVISNDIQTRYNLFIGTKHEMLVILFKGLFSPILGQCFLKTFFLKTPNIEDGCPSRFIED